MNHPAPSGPSAYNESRNQPFHLRQIGVREIQLNHTGSKVFKGFNFLVSSPNVHEVSDAGGAATA